MYVEELRERDGTHWPKWAEFGGSGYEQRPRLLRRIGWSTLWMVYLIGPIFDVFTDRSNGAEAIVAMLGLVSFAALWLRTVWTSWGSFRSAQARELAPLGLLAVLTIILPLAYGGDWLVLLAYLSVACAIALPPRQTIPAIAAVTAAILVAGLVTDLGLSTTAFFAFQTFVISLLAICVRQMRALIAELREAREELARLAVNEERLRFARDLHDLLGHSLSLIVLKSTLARKLLDRDATAASAELADIESVGRQSLVEVRQAVSGYRDQSLAAELDRARSALSAAGINATVHMPGTPLPAKVDALLSWAVREGVTNVLRHSRARRCDITVSCGAGTAELEVTDDGAALTGSARKSTGSGLRGLAERMASAGGHLEAGAQPKGGFRLAVCLPIGEPAAATSQEPAVAHGDPEERPRSPEEAVLEA